MFSSIYILKVCLFRAVRHFEIKTIILTFVCSFNKTVCYWWLCFKIKAKYLVLGYYYNLRTLFYFIKLVRIIESYVCSLIGYIPFILSVSVDSIPREILSSDISHCWHRTQVPPLSLTIHPLHFQMRPDPLHCVRIMLSENFP